MSEISLEGNPKERREKCLQMGRNLEAPNEIATRLEYSALMDKHVSNLKKWLFGVHRHCSAEYIQDYLNEYYFRLNGHRDNTVLFDTLMNLIVKNKPLH